MEENKTLKEVIKNEYPYVIPRRFIYELIIDKIQNYEELKKIRALFKK